MFSQVTETEVAGVSHLLALLKVPSKLLLLMLETKSLKPFGGRFSFGVTVAFLAF